VVEGGSVKEEENKSGIRERKQETEEELGWFNGSDWTDTYLQTTALTYHCSALKHS
jgi:hypothetical protein